MFRTIRESLTRTRDNVFGQIVTVLGGGEIDDETWEDVEALLIQADMGVPTTLELVENMRTRVDREGLYRTDQLVKALKEELRAMLTDPPPMNIDDPRQLTIVMVVGRQRLRQDDDHRQAGPLLQGAGPAGRARRRRHLSRGGD
jgi:fused signal recognition particle receptor